ncbi:hypothetical protein AVEN_209567-1 [Araneus ventricosus]|uniref:Uncharacterized protein n=1 Tax=Araneus ventricosus TaxID=182803 RepID=A0A4Y2XBB6_ARAVE|nr:hypothetical protein AVEN_78162-1 [Araneus ventricosus]GBO46917.1 hypothetical protein AVEN_209567-1 [Araneus ventricosus]
MMEERAKSFNLLRTTVTRVCWLLGIFSPDCYKYVPALMAFSCRLTCRRDTPALEQLGLTRKGPQQPRALCNVCQIEPHIFREAVLKGLNTRNK